MATIEQLEATLSALIANLSPTSRRALAKNIGQTLRKSQQERIKRQQNPDGSAFAPRKPRKQFGKKTGRIKRKAMFAKLRTARHLKLQTNANEVSIGFQGSSANIAEIHQYGKIGRVSDRIKVQYAQRELLGFTKEELEKVERLVIEQLRQL